MKREDSHISDQNLLLSVDGELSPRMAARIHAHLSNCWECRTRRQEIESAIADFIRIRQRSIDPLLPPIAGPRALLRAHLSQLGEAHPRIWLNWFTENVSARAAIFAALVGVTLVGIFRLSLTPPVSASEVLSRTRQAEVRQVERIPSAVIYEKLQLSRQSGSHLDTVTWEIWDDMQHQRLRQRAESDEEGSGHVTAIPSTHTRKDRPVGDLVEIYRSHQADLGRPLCAANYETWRAAIPQVSESVREGQLPDGEKATILEASGQGYAPPDALDAGEGAMRPGDVAAGLPRHDVAAFSELSNKTPSPGAARHPLPQGGEGINSISALPQGGEGINSISPRPLGGEGLGVRGSNPHASQSPVFDGPEASTPPNRIIKAELVVRSADWHPVEERLWVDDREYRIAELDYKVMPLQDVDTQVFSEPVAPAEPVEAPRPVVREVKEGLAPPAPNPDETEMTVRYGLHQLNADLGQPIEISRDSQGKILIDASNASPELQARLTQQLASLPNANLALEKVKEPACETCTVPSQETAPQVPLTLQTLAPAVNPNEKRLEEIFGDPNAQESFTREVLTVSGDALSHCYALRNLALRYTLAEEARLSPNAKEQLKGMVEDHFAALVEITNHLQGLLRPLLEALSNGSALSGDSLSVTATGVRADDKAVGPPDIGANQDLSPDSGPQWQEASLTIFAEVEKANRLVISLLPNTNNPMPADQVVPELRQALSEQQKALNKYQALIHKNY